MFTGKPGRGIQAVPVGASTPWREGSVRTSGDPHDLLNAELDAEVIVTRSAEEGWSGWAGAEADARFRRSMGNAAVGMCLVGADGHMIEMNEALCRFFGYDADALMRKTVADLTAEGYLEADLKLLAEVLSGDIDSYRIVKKYVHASGRFIWGDLSLSCLRDSAGQVEVLIAQVVDITADIVARESLDKQNRDLVKRLESKADSLTAEVSSAADYVASILPGDLDGPVRASSRYLPAMKIGGDSFGYSWIDDDHFVVYLIDVSGHGLEPALLSISVHNMLRSRSLPTAVLLNPDDLLPRLNRLFAMERQGGNYFTIWYGAFEVSTRTMRFVSAGHPPALVLSGEAEDDPTLIGLRTNSLPVGMFEDSSFESMAYTLPPGARMLLYSDGVLEFQESGRKTTSLPAFIDLLLEMSTSPDRSIDALIGRLRARTEGGSFADDCSLVALSFD